MPAEGVTMRARSAALLGRVVAVSGGGLLVDEKRTVNVAVQVLPLVEDVFPIVDRAIAVIRASGVKHEVCAMETVMEGPLDQLLDVAKAAHLACFEAGARKVVTVIKIGDQVGGTTIEEKVGRYRGTDAR
jgi:uncharacterized protein (TIGR00106 family)